MGDTAVDPAGDIVGYGNSAPAGETPQPYGEKLTPPGEGLGPAGDSVGVSEGDSIGAREPPPCVEGVAQGMKDDPDPPTDERNAVGGGDGELRSPYTGGWATGKAKKREMVFTEGAGRGGGGEGVVMSRNFFFNYYKIILH